MISTYVSQNYVTGTDVLHQRIHSKVSSLPEPLGPESTGRRMDDLREEIGVLFSLTGRIGRSQMTWMEEVVYQREQMKQERLRGLG